MQSANVITLNSTLSNSSNNSTGADFARRVGNIIDKARLGRGWNPLQNDDHDKAVAAWLEILVNAGVKPDALPFCYRRAQEMVARAIADGKDEPAITANYLVAAWNSGGREAYFQKLNENKKQLTASDNPGENCPRCLGYNREYVYDAQTGREIGLKQSCEHRRLEPGEWLYKKHEGDPRDGDPGELVEIDLAIELSKLEGAFS